MTDARDAREIELKNCPFCGGSEQMAIERTCDRTTPYNPADFAYPRVICKCGVEVPGKNWEKKATAIAAWNRRAPDPSSFKAGLERAAAWRPIETFPKDCFPQITWSLNGGLAVAFIDATGAWWPCPATEPLKHIPTHWMPAPSRPNSIRSLSKGGTADAETK